MLPEGIEPGEVVKIASGVAWRYARRCWWADVDDLIGEASRVVLEAARTWDPQVGVPFSGYAAKAAQRALSGYLWEQSSPVTSSDPRIMAGTYRAEVDPEAHPVDPTAPRLLDDAHWRLRVRAGIRRIAARTRDGEYAIPVLVHGVPPHEVPAPRQTVYRAVHLVRRKMRDDRELYQLWQATR